MGAGRKENRYSSTPAVFKVLTGGNYKAPPRGEAQVGSTSDTTHVGVFTREAHASNLLGQAVELKLTRTGCDSSPQVFGQLDRTIQALSLLLEHDLKDANGAYFCGAVAMCNRYAD